MSGFYYGSQSLSAVGQGGGAIFLSLLKGGIISPFRGIGLSYDDVSFRNVLLILSPVVKTPDDIHDDLAVACPSVPLQPPHIFFDISLIGLEPFDSSIERMIAALALECLRKQSADARSRLKADKLFQVLTEGL